MSSVSTRWRVLGVGVVCAAAGAGGGAIATAGASPSHTSAAATHHSAARASHRRLRSHLAGRRGGPMRRLAARAVHGDITVQTSDGWGTVTFDRGTVESIDGDQITLAEGTRTATDKTVTITVPSTAAVHDDGAMGTLSSLTTGQRAIIVQLPTRTVVLARTPQTSAQN